MAFSLLETGGGRQVTDIDTTKIDEYLAKHQWHAPFTIKLRRLITLLDITHDDLKGTTTICREIANHLRHKHNATFWDYRGRWTGDRKNPDECLGAIYSIPKGRDK